MKALSKGSIAVSLAALAAVSLPLSASAQDRTNDAGAASSAASSAQDIAPDSQKAKPERSAKDTVRSDSVAKGQEAQGNPKPKTNESAVPTQVAAQQPKPDNGGENGKRPRSGGYVNPR